MSGSGPHRLARTSNFSNPAIPRHCRKTGLIRCAGTSIQSCSIAPRLTQRPAGAAIGAMADAAVLAVEASRTSKHQILSDQRALQLSGVKLAGCIMIKTK